MRPTIRFRASRWSASFVALSLLLLSGGLISLQQQARKSSDGLEPVDVGMVALLSAPQKYEGRFIRVIGFVSIEFEGEAIYLHEEDYRHGLIKNSLSLRLSESQRKQFKGLSPKYMLIEGVIYANGPEQTESSGAIGNITRFEVWPIVRRAGGRP